MTPKNQKKQHFHILSVLVRAACETLHKLDYVQQMCVHVILPDLGLHRTGGLLLSVGLLL